MDSAQIVRRLYDNLSWTAAFGADNPCSLAALPAEVWARIASAWGDTDETFIGLLFLWILGRPADPGELTAYRALLTAGAPRSAVVRRMALSDEARACGLDVSWLPRIDAREPDIVWKCVWALWPAPDKAFVEGLYPVLLVRPPDEDGVKAFCAVLEAGAPRSAVVRQMALSDEARAWGLDVSWVSRVAALDAEAEWRRVQAVLDAPDRAFVEGLYLALLARPADQPALVAICAALAAGMPRSTVVRDVALSEEARGRGLNVSWLPRLADLEAALPAPADSESFRSLTSVFRRWLAGWKAPAPSLPREAKAPPRLTKRKAAVRMQNVE